MSKAKSNVHHLNSGIRGGLWETKHRKAMGDAIWLFGWLILRQTTEENGAGLVLGGKAICYREIEEETGFPVETVRRWMARLRRKEYIAVQRRPTGLIVAILNAKKFVRPAPQTVRNEHPGCPDLNVRAGRNDQGERLDLNVRTVKFEDSLPRKSNGFNLQPAPIEKERKIERNGKKPLADRRKAPTAGDADPRHAEVRTAIQKLWIEHNPDIPTALWGAAEGQNLRVFLRENQSWGVEHILRCVQNRFASESNHSEPPRAWLRDLAKYAGGPLDRFGKPRKGSLPFEQRVPKKEFNRAEERDRRNAEAIARVFPS